MNYFQQQRLKNAKSDSATKMWSNYLYQYVAMYLVHSIVLKVALNNMLNTTVKRPNIPICDTSPIEKYVQAEGENLLGQMSIRLKKNSQKLISTF